MLKELWDMIVNLFTNKTNKKKDSITGNGKADLIIEQAIIDAESLLANGSTQKQHAISSLEQSIIGKLGLLDYTDLTIDETVEVLYNALKLSGKLDDVKKVVSDRDLSIAETVITNIRRGK